MAAITDEDREGLKRMKEMHLSMFTGPSDRNSLMTLFNNSVRELFEALTGLYDDGCAPPELSLAVKYFEGAVAITPSLPIEQFHAVISVPPRDSWIGDRNEDLLRLPEIAKFGLTSVYADLAPTVGKPADERPFVWDALGNWRMIALMYSVPDEMRGILMNMGTNVIDIAVSATNTVAAEHGSLDMSDPKNMVGLIQNNPDFMSSVQTMFGSMMQQVDQLSAAKAVHVPPLDGDDAAGAGVESGAAAATVAPLDPHIAATLAADATTKMRVDGVRADLEKMVSATASFVGGIDESSKVAATEMFDVIANEMDIMKMMEGMGLNRAQRRAIEKNKAKIIAQTKESLLGSGAKKAKGKK